MQGYCDVFFLRIILKRTSTEAHVYMRRHHGAKVTHFDVSNVIYHKFSHGAVSYTLYGANVCRVPKCPAALNVRQILFFSKSVIMMQEITIYSKLNKYLKKIISEKYSESNLEKKIADI